MKCKSCKTRIPDEKNNSNNKIVTCPKCRTVSTNPDEDFLNSLPDKIKVKEKDGNLHIFYSWFTWGDLLCLLGMASLNIYSFILLRIILEKPIIIIIYPIIWFLTYFYIVRVINKTVIEIKKDRLISKHGPLPWFGNQNLEGKEIKEIYSREIQSKTITYIVKALLKDGREVKIISFLQTPVQALFIEKKLTKYLNII